MKHFNKRHEKGNVLFLILIAVALFAALSYAVTQSSRSGGDASRETNVLNAAQLTQYPTSLRTAVLRLIIDGFQDTGILYNEPGNLTASVELEVFSSIGGGAVFQRAPREMMDQDGPNPVGEWFINMDFEVPELGRSVPADIAGNELIAFLPGINESVCTRINMEAGIIDSAAVANPVIDAGTYFGGGNGHVDKNVEAFSDYSTTTTVVITDGNAISVFDGQAFGCFRDTTPASRPYVMYTVLLER